MRRAFIAELLRQARIDDSVLLIVGDLGYGVVEPFAEEFPHRFINAGVAEQNMIGMAAGLASHGYRAFVYSIGNFPTLRALEQIRNDVCYHRLNVTVVAVGSGLSYGALGYSHHAVEDIAVMRALPGMRVISPADSAEASAAVAEAVRDGGPRYIRLSSKEGPEIHTATLPESLSQPRWLSSGEDLAILGAGGVLDACLQAARAIQASTVSSVGVASCPTVAPLSVEFFSELGVGARIITVEEHIRSGGFGSAVLELSNDLELGFRLRRIGISDPASLGVGSQSYLLQRAGISVEAITLAGEELLSLS